MAVRAAYAAGFEAEAKTPDGMMESRAFRSRRERQETSRLRLLPAASPPEAPIEVLRQRITARQASGQDPSEATLAVLERQLQWIEPLGQDEPRQPLQ